jgi:hypothetical protein
VESFAVKHFCIQNFFSKPLDGKIKVVYDKGVVEGEVKGDSYEILPRVRVHFC